jgi:monothiol glutaredoxin
MSDIQQKIQETISNNDVVLYMKGTKDFPQCGFSAVVVQILKNVGVDFLDVDVLRDPEIRQGIKDFSDWPTIPQLYIKGEFIGGCDIVKEMFQSGELQEILKK